MTTPHADTLRDHLRQRNSSLAARADTFWSLAEQIHDRQTRPDANENGYSHCQAVETNIWLLITKCQKLPKFKDIELFLLSCAACCHDFDKGLNHFRPGQIDHGMGSAQFIIDHDGEFPLREPEINIIERIIAIHGYIDRQYHDKLSELEDSYPIGGVGIDIQRLALILKTADILHTDNTRVSRYVDLSQLAPGDRRKHLARKCIAGWQIKGDSVVITGEPRNLEEYEALLGCEKFMEDREWPAIAPELRAHRFPHKLKFVNSDRYLTREAEHAVRADGPGMDFYHEEDTAIFAGRERDIEETEKNIFHSKISRLIGPSGVGKSSLIHAGLVPKFRKLAGWGVVVTRPNKKDGNFFTPSNFVNLLGPIPEPNRPFHELCQGLARKFRKMLIVFDQFEDVAFFGTFDPEAIAAELFALRTVGLDAHLLFSYREDVESTLHDLWLKLTTASHMNAHYLKRLNKQAAQEALKRLMRMRAVQLAPEEGILGRLVDELAAATDQESGMATGSVVYPPFIQMTASFLAGIAKNSAVTLDTLERAANGSLSSAETIIAGHFKRCLAEMETSGYSPEAARNILIALSRANGRKGAIEHARIVLEAGLKPDALPGLLDEMARLRLIRRLPSEQWEIVHDLMARHVIEHVTDEKELRFKQVREALETRARTFRTHHNFLTRQELTDLWLNRKRIQAEALTDDERLLILISMFSIDPHIMATVGEKGHWLNQFNPDRYGIPGWTFFHDLSEAALIQLATRAAEVEGIGGALSFCTIQRHLHSSRNFNLTARISNKNFNAYDQTIADQARKTMVDIACRTDLPMIQSILNDPGRKARWAAAEAWSKIASHNDLLQIASLLHDENWRVREAAAEAWGKIASHDDLPQIARLLRDEEVIVCWAAAEAWGKIASHDDLPQIARLLRDENPQVREAAAQAWGKIASHDDLPQIDSLLGDENPQVRAAAAEAWGMIASHDDLPQIISLLWDEDDDVHDAVAQAWGMIATHDDLPQIASLLRDENWQVRRAAAEAWGKIATHDDLPQIASLLRDENWQVSWAAAQAWGMIVTRDDLPQITSLLRDEDSDVRQAAAQAWSKLATHDDLPQIVNLLQDEYSDVREDAAQACGKLATREDISLFEPLLKDGNMAVRLAAMSIIRKVSTPQDLMGILERNEEELAPEILGILDWLLFAPSCLRAAYDEEENKKNSSD